MNARWLLCAALIGAGWPAASGHAGARMTFAGQIRGLAEDVKKSLADDPRLKNQRVAVGAFSAQGKRVKDSNFGLRIEKDLRTLLAAQHDDAAKLTLAGSYHYVEAESADNKGSDVLVITAQIQNDRGKEIVSITREVNDTGDIAAVLGITMAPPDVKDFKQRNEAASKASAKPSFLLLDGTRIAAHDNNRYAIELRRKAGGAGTAQPVVPRDEAGKAYAEINIGDEYEVVLYNYDEHSDAVGRLTIDGLDAANAFNADGVQYPGYFVPRSQAGKPGEHIVSGWLHTVKKTGGDDNVYVFVVNELGKGAASARKVRGGIGVITVQFFDACEPHEKLRPRSFGETGQGHGMKVDYQVKQVQVGSDPIAIVSVRYSRAP